MELREWLDYMLTAHPHVLLAPMWAVIGIIVTLLWWPLLASP